MGFSWELGCGCQQFDLKLLGCGFRDNRDGVDGGFFLLAGSRGCFSFVSAISGIVSFSSTDVAGIFFSAFLLFFICLRGEFLLLVLLPGLVSFLEFPSAVFLLWSPNLGCKDFSGSSQDSSIAPLLIWAIMRAALFLNLLG